MSDTNWVHYGDENYDFGTMTFVPMLDADRAALLAALREDDELDESDERMEATHFGIQVMYPKVEDADTQEERDELTWHDFSAMPAKQVDGLWYVWYEDVGSTGCVWYQSTYTRKEVEAVRDVAIQLASEGRLYDGLYDAVRTGPMAWW